MPANEMPYRHWNPLVRFYFSGTLKKAVELAGLNGNETVLDFGCGTRQLRLFLPKGVKYIGFDIVAENSDVTGFEAVKPDVIFALNVLEHLGQKQLLETVSRFKRMGAKTLVVSQPTEHFLSRALAWLHGYGAEHKQEHKLNCVQVHRILQQQLKLEKMVAFFTMQKLSKWSLS